jgi:ABC-type Na+ efflux pump permease subunit
MMGTVSLWTFSFQVTGDTDERGIAYNLGRQTMETVKMSGFQNAAEGAVTVYYDGMQNAVTQASGNACYSVTTSITSDQVSSGVAGQAGATPATGALRTVIITVTFLDTGKTLYQTNTYMARYGV